MNGRQIFSIHIVLKCQRSSAAQTFARLQHFCTFVIEIKDRMQYCMEESKRGCRARALGIGSSWSYSRENGPLRSNTSTSSSHHAKMWGVDYAIFGIIRNAMSCGITRWNVTIFWRADFVSYHFKSKSCFFINIYFHQTESDRANRYHWTLPPPPEKYSSIFHLFCFHYKGKRGLLQ